jgi:2-methylcitrate dehydratase PrpD
MPDGLTHWLGKFVSGLRFEALPAGALDVVRAGVTDCIATMLAGRNEQVTQTLKQVIGPGLGGEATLYFSGERASAPNAACINGTAAHALDYDDVALRGHPSAAIVPAIFAEGEVLSSSGRDLVTAYVAGYEAWAELVDRERGKHHEKGWHPTGIFGPLGAAAACARLRKLDADRTAIALGIAASHAGGLMSNFGTMTKPFHAGRAAQSGLMAARLATAGMTASIDALEHPQGFLSAVSPAGDFDASVPAQDEHAWQITTQGLSIKKYPICFAAHRAVDAVLDLRSAHKITPEQVEGVVVELSVLAAKLLRNAKPQTGLAAKFSIQFAMASALITGRVGLAELTDEFVRRPDVQELMTRVSVKTNERYDNEAPVQSVADRVDIVLRSGERIEGEPVHRPLGHPSRPLPAGALKNKFRECVEAAGANDEAAVKLFNRLQAIDEVTSVRDLVATPL